MLAYVNGEFVEDAHASVSVRDRGFMLGDAVFEVWRTYGGTPCEAMIEKNLARLTRGLCYMELDAEPIVAEVRATNDELLRRNAEQLAETGDVLVFTIVTRGFVDEIAGGPGSKPTIVMFHNPIPDRGGAQAGDDLYGKGARLVTSLMYRDPFGAVDPRIKTTSRFAYARAERKMSRSGPRTWTLFCDNDGNQTEASGGNVFIVEDGTLMRPPRERVLGGINMTTFLELAQGLGIPVEERNLTLYDYLSADEVILTTTSVGAVRVTELDGIALKPKSDVYDRVLQAFFEHVGYDFVTPVRERAGVLTPGA